MPDARGRPSPAPGTGCAASACSTVCGQAQLVVERAGRRRRSGRAGPAAGRSGPWSEVLPDEPVTPTTVRSGSRSTTARASRAHRGQRVGDHDRRHAGRPAGCRAPRPRRRRPRPAAKSCPSTLLAGERDEQPARRRPCGSRTRPARSPGVAGRRRRAAPPTTAAISASVIGIMRAAPREAGAASAAASSTRSSNGSISPSISWPRSWPLPSSATTSPGSASAHRLGDRRPAGPAPRRPCRPPAAARARPAPSARIAAGSSVRGLSSVTMSRSAPRAAAAPMSGRLPRSRSPPAPITQISAAAAAGPARAARPARPRSRPACARSRRPRAPARARSTRSSRPGTPGQAATPGRGDLRVDARPRPARRCASSALATLCRPGSAHARPSTEAVRAERGEALAERRRRPTSRGAPGRRRGRRRPRR